MTKLRINLISILIVFISFGIMVGCLEGDDGFVLFPCEGKDCEGFCINKDSTCCGTALVVDEFFIAQHQVLVPVTCPSSAPICCGSGQCATEEGLCPPKCEPGEKECKSGCIPVEDTCCPETAINFLCPQETPFCCTGEESIVFDPPFIGQQCAAAVDECIFALPLPVPPEEILPPSDIVTVPILLTPINNEVIKQNNPDCGCTFDEGSGYGYCILFDWTDSTSPNGIAGYFFRKRPPTSQEDLDLGISLRNWNEFYVSESERFEPDEIDEFIERDCNQRISFCSWEWQVQAVDNLGNTSFFSALGNFQFSACTLEDGTPCPNNDFCSF